MKSILIALVLSGVLFAGGPDSGRVAQAGENLQTAAMCQTSVLAFSAVGFLLTAGTGGIGWVIGGGVGALAFYIAGIYNTYAAGTNLMPAIPVDSTNAAPAKIFTAPY